MICIQLPCKKFDILFMQREVWRFAILSTVYNHQNCLLTILTSCRWLIILWWLCHIMDFLTIKWLNVTEDVIKWWEHVEHFVVLGPCWLLAFVNVIEKYLMLIPLQPSIKFHHTNSARATKVSGLVMEGSRRQEWWRNRLQKNL